MLVIVDIKRKISKHNHSNTNNIKYIVCHDTGNYRDTAEANANYFNGGDRQASAHYFVDENEIYQVVEEFKAAWHCGDGGNFYGINNHNSIGIEMCNSGGIISKNTIENTLWLVKQLQNKYNINKEQVVRHYDASRKNCPNNMSQNNWYAWWEFKKSLEESNSSNYENSKDYGLATVTANTGVNVRAGAGSDFNKIGVLPKGADVRIGFISNNWANIYFGNNGGWVCMDYLSLYKIFKNKRITNKDV